MSGALNVESQLISRLCNLLSKTRFVPPEKRDEDGFRTSWVERSTYPQIRECQSRVANERVWRYLRTSIAKYGMDAWGPYPDDKGKYKYVGVTPDGNRCESTFSLFESFDVVMDILSRKDDDMIVLTEDEEDYAAFHAYDVKRYITFAYRTWQMACIEHIELRNSGKEFIFSLSYDAEVDANFRVVYALDNRYPSAEMHRVAASMENSLFEETMSCRLVMRQLLYDLTLCYPQQLYERLPDKLIMLGIGYVLDYSRRTYNIENDDWPSFFIELIDRHVEFIAFLWNSERYGVYAEKIVRAPPNYIEVYERLKRLRTVRAHAKEVVASAKRVMAPRIVGGTFGKRRRGAGASSAHAAEPAHVYSDAEE